MKWLYCGKRWGWAVVLQQCHWTWCWIPHLRPWGTKFNAPFVFLPCLSATPLKGGYSQGICMYVLLIILKNYIPNIIIKILTGIFSTPNLLKNYIPNIININPYRYTFYTKLQPYKTIWTGMCWKCWISWVFWLYVYHETLWIPLADMETNSTPVTHLLQFAP